MKKSVYESFGDVNFFDGGILIQRITETEYNYMSCYPMYDEDNYKYLFSVCTVDLDFVDEDMKLHCDCGVRVETNEEIVRELVEHYGTFEFDGYDYKMYKNEIIDYINDEITMEMVNELFWLNNFDNDCRNLVYEVTDIYGFKTVDEYETQEDCDYNLEYLEVGEIVKLLSK